jgi:hypothetical protein
MVEKKNHLSPGEADTSSIGASDMRTSQAPLMPEISFSTFVFSLNSSALVHLGMLEAPGSDTRTKDLIMAKQTIDILGMLEQKTRGNLDQDEEQLLRNILHDLRMMYVKENS